MTRPQNDRATRVLIVSGEIGQGHEAVARAVHETVTRDRPDCDIRVAEAFARMGHGSGPVFRWLFEFAVQWTPLLQEAWYAAVTRSRLVRWFYREVMGAWVARALAEDLAGEPTDVVVSTHQLATAGLAWLRRRGLLDARIVAAVCDFAPHAYWTYPGVDEYLVLDDLAREPTRAMDPGAAVTVRSPLVGAPFAPVGDDEARAARRGARAARRCAGGGRDGGLAGPGRGGRGGARRPGRPPALPRRRPLRPRRARPWPAARPASQGRAASASGCPAGWTTSRRCSPRPTSSSTTPAARPPRRPSPADGPS